MNDLDIVTFQVENCRYIVERVNWDNYEKDKENLAQILAKIELESSDV